MEEHIRRVALTAPESAINLELDHHLQAMDMQTKKTTIKAKRGTDGDRV